MLSRFEKAWPTADPKLRRKPTLPDKAKTTLSKKRNTKRAESINKLAKETNGEIVDLTKLSSLIKEYEMHINEGTNKYGQLKE